MGTPFLYAVMEELGRVRRAGWRWSGLGGSAVVDVLADVGVVVDWGWDCGGMDGAGFERSSSSLTGW